MAPLVLGWKANKYGIIGTSLKPNSRPYWGCSCTYSILKYTFKYRHRLIHTYIINARANLSVNSFKNKSLEDLNLVRV